MYRHASWKKKNIARELGTLRDTGNSEGIIQTVKIFTYKEVKRR